MKSPLPEPSYPGPERSAGVDREDEAPTRGPNRGANPAQGDHRAAGGCPEHHGPDGGTGMGHQAPPGWPKDHHPGV
jgi:hypothetical protein